MIIGEAGIGKTALAEFLAAEAAEDGGTVLRTRCYETERSLFLQPIVEAIAPVVASTSADTLRQTCSASTQRPPRGCCPRWRRHPRPPPPGRGSMEMERRRAFEAVRAFLRGLAERHPVLVLVDDLQYAGQSTVELMHFLGRRAGGPGCWSWPPCGPRTRADRRRARLRWPAARGRPARPGAVAQLARAAGQGALADRILERTRGHTLFVVEVLQALAQRDEACPSPCGPPFSPASGAPGRRWRPCSARRRCSAPRSTR